MTNALNGSLSDRRLNRIVKNLEKGRCILLLGTGTDVVDPQGAKRNISLELADLLAEEMNETFESGATLPYVAQVYVEKGSDPVSEVAKEFIEEFEVDLEADCALAHLAQLPFSLVVTTRHDHIFDEYLRRAGKDPYSVCYDVNSGGTPSIPDKCMTADRPLVFHLTGNIQDPDSLVLTEENILGLLKAIALRRPRVPERIRAEFQKRNRMALLVGFGVPKWYTRVVLDELGMPRDRAEQSYAFGEFDRFLRVSDHEAAYFHAGEFNIQTILGDSDDLVRAVLDRWESEGRKQPPSVSPAAGERVFLSYVGADREYARSVYEAFTARKVDCFWDQDGMRIGDFWRDRLRQEIDEATSFVLLVSPKLHNNTDSIVHVEAGYAWERFKARNARSLFPVWIAGESRPYDLVGHSDFPSLSHRTIDIEDPTTLATLVDDVLGLEGDARTNGGDE